MLNVRVPGSKILHSGLKVVIGWCRKLSLACRKHAILPSCEMKAEAARFGPELSLQSSTPEEGKLNKLFVCNR